MKEILDRIIMTKRHYFPPFQFVNADTEASGISNIKETSFILMSHLVYSLPNVLSPSPSKATSIVRSKAVRVKGQRTKHSVAAQDHD